jgi:hypothetical protein
MPSLLVPDLRAQLAAVINTPHTHSHLSSNSALHAHGYSDGALASASQSPHNIDPAIASAQHQHQPQLQHIDMMSASAGDSGDDNGDGRKGGKRELSQSKRAAQNRAAQVCGAIFLCRELHNCELEMRKRIL